jgi:serine/threonine protein kinase
VILGSKFSSKSDIYGMGIVLWEMVNRCTKGFYEKPFSEYTELIYDFQILMQAAQQGRRPSIPSACPVAVEVLIHKCLDQNPEKRPECKQILQLLMIIENEYLENKTDWDNRTRRTSANTLQQLFTEPSSTPSDSHFGMSAVSLVSSTETTYSSPSPSGRNENSIPQRTV